jgi:hypothetical protein
VDTPQQSDEQRDNQSAVLQRKVRREAVSKKH